MVFKFVNKFLSQTGKQYLWGPLRQPTLWETGVDEEKVEAGEKKPFNSTFSSSLPSALGLRVWLQPLPRLFTFEERNFRF